MLEELAFGLFLHLGKKTIDHFWKERRSDKNPVANQNGNIQYAATDLGRTKVGREFTIARNQEYETIFGNIYLPDTLQDWIDGDEIIVVLVIDESTEQMVLFESDIEGYEIDLPHGIYSIFTFLMDPEDEEFLNAEIYAIGFPCAEHIDLSGIKDFSLEDYQDIWEILDTTPIQIMRGGPFYLDFIFIDTDDEPELPKCFSELMDPIESNEEWSAVSWDLQNMDEFQFYNLLDVANEGDSEAQFQLGKMYMSGRYFTDGFVVQQDKQEAIKYVTLAAVRGHNKAREYLQKKE